MIQGKGRFENIDVLRGVAALFVVWLHGSELYVNLPGMRAIGTLGYDVPKFLELGRVGVIAFFAISGFVVASTIRPPRYAGTVAFAIKRVFRLYPAYWLTLALTYVSLSLWSTYMGGPAVVPTVGAVAANASMLPTIFGVQAALGHFWTLEIEFVFYAVVVLLFVAGKLHEPKVVVPLICVLTLNVSGLLLGRLTWAPGQGHWGQLPQCLAIMLWGSLLRRSYDPGATALQKLKAWRTTPIIIASVFVLGRALGFGSMQKAPDLATYLGGLGTLWGLLLFLAFALAGRGWHRGIVWLGTVSYSIYLLHPLVVYPVYYFLLKHPEWVVLPIGGLVVLVATATVAIASITYLLVEAPANRLASSLARRFDAGHPGPAARTSPLPADVKRG